MTTNNHSAHAPLTSRRLHQMRDILSKSSAQRDGGDIGYAMSDAVKLIDGVLAVKSAPLMFIDGNISPEDAEKLIVAIDELNREPRDAQVMIAEPVSEPYKLISITDGMAYAFHHALSDSSLGSDDVEEIKTGLRAALANVNSPVTPDGWIKCSDRMPGSQEWVIVFAKWANQQVLCWDDVASRWTDFEDQSYFHDMFTHWQPLPAAPQQEVK